MVSYRFAFLAICSPRRFSCSLSSGVSASPKSSASNIWRISTSVSSNGARLSHSIASSFDFTCHSQKPATSSFASVKGPSITVRFVPENLTRAPFELGWSPSAASSTPAFASSSLYFIMSPRIFLSGRMPASESLFALTITMNRIVISPLLTRRTKGCKIDTPGKKKPADFRGRGREGQGWRLRSARPLVDAVRQCQRLLCVHSSSGKVAHLYLGSKHPHVRPQLTSSDDDIRRRFGRFRVGVNPIRQHIRFVRQTHPGVVVDGCRRVHADQQGFELVHIVLDTSDLLRLDLDGFGCFGCLGLF